MVLTKNTFKERKKGRKKKSRWEEIKNIYHVPKTIRTSLDYKKNLFNSKESKKLLNDHFNVNIKNITKKVKNFGFRREREVIGYKVGKNNKEIPVFKSKYVWDPPEFIIKAYPELEHEKKRFMYKKDTAAPLAYMILKEVRNVKDKLYTLKRGQPKKGYGLITINDIDTVFGKTYNNSEKSGNTNSSTNHRNLSHEDQIHLNFGKSFHDLMKLNNGKSTHKKKKKRKVKIKK